MRCKNTKDAIGDAEAFGLPQKKRAELVSDAELAEFLGVSRSYVTRLLSGERPLTALLKARLGRPDRCD
jgi:transcriptional regulator with XRE-family HTH domain